MYFGCVMQGQASGYTEASVVECLMDFGRIPGSARNYLFSGLVCLAGVNYLTFGMFASGRVGFAT